MHRPRRARSKLGLIGCGWYGMVIVKAAKAGGVADEVRQLQWGEFIFPLHGRWYRAAQMNAPANPVEEFSTREYGRFGYFFRREIKQHTTLALHYRFLLSGIPEPAESPKRSAAEIATVRREMDLAYANFVRDPGP